MTDFAEEAYRLAETGRRAGWARYYEAAQARDAALARVAELEAERDFARAWRAAEIEVLIADAPMVARRASQERDFVASWLKDYLGERGGEASSSDIKQAAKDADIGTGALRAAFKRVGITTFRRDGAPSKTYWHLAAGEVSA